MAIVIIVTYNNLTSFVNDIEINEPAGDENANITQPSRSEIKMYLFAAETIMKPAYKSIVKKCALSGDEKVMDFGSGAGPSSNLIAKELEKGSGELTCLDISESWIKVVRHRFQDFDNVNYLLGDITTMELEENIYDVILIHFVLHDIDKEIRSIVIEKLASLLKTNGRLIIREPTSSNHGIPAEEIQELMISNGLQEQILQSGKMLLFIPVIEGIYYKI
jgi:ubiquinone/menaquinone biosynthesis C-methylase UbiE